MATYGKGALDFLAEPRDASVTARLHHERLVDITLKGVVEYAVEKLGEALVEKYKTRVMQGVKPKHLIKAARELAAKEIMENMEVSVEIKGKKVSRQ